MGSVGSVHFRIVPWSGLYFSRSIGPFLYVVGTNYRVLIYCTCHFQGGSLCLASSVCWSLQCLFSTLTQGGSGGHFFRLTCSVVLWGGRDSLPPHGLQPTRLLRPWDFPGKSPGVGCHRLLQVEDEAVLKRESITDPVQLLSWETRCTVPELSLRHCTRKLWARYWVIAPGLSSPSILQNGLILLLLLSGLLPFIFKGQILRTLLMIFRSFGHFLRNDAVKTLASQVTLVVRNPAASVGDAREEDSMPGLGRSSGERNGNPLQYSCLDTKESNWFFGRFQTALLQILSHVS